MKNFCLSFVFILVFGFNISIDSAHSATKSEMLLQLDDLREQLSAMQTTVKVSASSTPVRGKLQSFKLNDQDIAISFKYKDKKKLSFENGFMEEPYDGIYQINAYRKLSDKEKEKKGLYFNKQDAFSISVSDLETYNKNIKSIQAELDYIDNKYKVKKNFYPGEMEAFKVYQLEGWYIIEFTKSDRYGGKGGKFSATLTDYTDTESVVSIGAEWGSSLNFTALPQGEKAYGYYKDRKATREVLLSLMRSTKYELK